MKGRKIKTWKITGGVFVIIYIILTIYSFLHDTSYDPEFISDLGGWAPLVVTNFPGLLVVMVIFNVLNIKATTTGEEIVFWSVMIITNVLFYFGFGAGMGAVWKMFKDQLDNTDKQNGVETLK